MTELDFLTAFATIGMTIIALVALFGFARDSVKATFAAFGIILNRRADKGLRKQKSLVVLAWFYWLSGLIAAAKTDPASVTLLLIGLGLTVFAIINGRRLHKMQEDSLNFRTRVQSRI